MSGSSGHSESSGQVSCTKSVKVFTWCRICVLKFTTSSTVMLCSRVFVSSLSNGGKSGWAQAFWARTAANASRLVQSLAVAVTLVTQVVYSVVSSESRIASREWK